MKQKILLPFLILYYTFTGVTATYGQSREITLTLDDAIALAADSSLTAFRYKNMYRSSYWAYRSYRANRLPSLTLDLIPAQYYRNMTQRYDSENDMDLFREQQMFSASGGLSLRQNVDFLGGTLYANTELDYLYNFGDTRYSQFSAIPFQIGYSQNLLGYNAYRWERKIEPLKYERARQELIYNIESLSGTVVDYFFSLALAQANYDLAMRNAAATDTLCRVGERKYAIAAISQADLLIPALTQTLYRLAVCSQVDFFAINGLESVNGGAGVGFTVGKVRVDAKASTGATGAMSASVSPAAVSYLEQTGLLYPGVPVFGGVLC